MLDIPATYETSRERFCASLASFRNVGFDPVLTSIPLADNPDLTIDILRADAAREKQKLFILTTGLHGIEGYVGAGAMMSYSCPPTQRGAKRRRGLRSRESLASKGSWEIERRGNVQQTMINASGRAFGASCVIAARATSSALTRL